MQWKEDTTAGSRMSTSRSAYEQQDQTSPLAMVWCLAQFCVKFNGMVIQVS